MKKEEIEKEIHLASSFKEKHLNRVDNYFLAFLSMLFGLSASFLAQIYITKNPDLINDLFIGSLIICIISGGAVFLKIKKTRKEVEKGHNRIIELAHEYIKELDNEERSKIK